MGRGGAAAAALAAFWFLAPGTAVSAACPQHPLGVLEGPGGTAGDWRFVATAASQATAPDQQAERDALGEARLEARAMLAGDPRLNLRLDGVELRGAYDLQACRVGDRVYASVALDRASLRSAAELERGMDAGARVAGDAKPPQAIQVPKAGPDRSVFERLLGPTHPQGKRMRTDRRAVPARRV